MSYRVDQDNLKRILEFLHEVSLQYPYQYASMQNIINATGISESEVIRIGNHIITNYWADPQYAGTNWKLLRITQDGIDKLDQIASIKTATSKSSSHTVGINWTKWGTIIGGISVIIVIIFGVAQYYQNDQKSTELAIPNSIQNIGSGNVIVGNNNIDVDNTNSDSPILLLGEKQIDCNVFPDGESGFNFVNKTLGYMISWPNLDWILTKDLMKHRSNFGLDSGESYLGGTHVSRERGFTVQIAVFDISDPIKNDFDEWIRLQKEEYVETLTNMTSTSFIAPEKNSARLEVHGVIQGANFSMYERLLKYDNKIYLIQKHLMSPEKYPPEYSDQAEDVRASFRLLSNCKS